LPATSRSDDGPGGAGGELPAAARAEHPDFSHVTDEGIAAAVARWPELERLDIGGMPGTSPSRVPRHRRQLSAPRALDVLPLGAGSPAAYGLTDACVQAIAEGCPLLQELDLTNWASLTDAALLAVASRARSWSG
jgi:hypothetical protein